MAQSSTSDPLQFLVGRRIKDDAFWKGIYQSFVSIATLMNESLKPKTSDNRYPNDKFFSYNELVQCKATSSEYEILPPPSELEAQPQAKPQANAKQMEVPLPSQQDDKSKQGSKKPANKSKKQNKANKRMTLALSNDAKLLIQFIFERTRWEMCTISKDEVQTASLDTLEFYSSKLTTPPIWASLVDAIKSKSFKYSLVEFLIIVAGFNNKITSCSMDSLENRIKDHFKGVIRNERILGLTATLLCKFTESLILNVVTQNWFKRNQTLQSNSILSLVLLMWLKSHKASEKCALLDDLTEYAKQAKPAVKPKDKQSKASIKQKMVPLPAPTVPKSQANITNDLGTTQSGSVNLTAPRPTVPKGQHSGAPLGSPLAADGARKQPMKETNTMPPIPIPLTPSGTPKTKKITQSS